MPQPKLRELDSPTECHSPQCVAAVSPRLAACMTLPDDDIGDFIAVPENIAARFTKLTESQGVLKKDRDRMPLMPAVAATIHSSEKLEPDALASLQAEDDVQDNVDSNNSVRPVEPPPPASEASGSKVQHPTPGTAPSAPMASLEECDSVIATRITKPVPRRRQNKRCTEYVEISDSKPYPEYAEEYRRLLLYKKTGFFMIQQEPDDIVPKIAGRKRRLDEDEAVGRDKEDVIRRRFEIEWYLIPSTEVRSRCGASLTHAAANPTFRFEWSFGVLPTSGTFMDFAGHVFPGFSEHYLPLAKQLCKRKDVEAIIDEYRRVATDEDKLYPLFKALAEVIILVSMGKKCPDPYFSLVSGVLVPIEHTHDVSASTLLDNSVQRFHMVDTHRKKISGLDCNEQPDFILIHQDGERFIPPKNFAWSEIFFTVEFKKKGNTTAAGDPKPKAHNGSGHKKQRKQNKSVNPLKTALKDQQSSPYSSSFVVKEGKTCSVTPRQQLARYNGNIVSAGGLIRMHSLGLLLTGVRAELLWQDRSNIICSTECQFADDFAPMLAIIVAVTQCGSHVLGFDPRFTKDDVYPTSFPRIKISGFTPVVPGAPTAVFVGGEELNTRPKLPTKNALNAVKEFPVRSVFGPSTSVRSVEFEGDSSIPACRYVLRASWSFPERPSEAMIIKMGTEMKVTNLPHLIAYVEGTPPDTNSPGERLIKTMNEFDIPSPRQLSLMVIRATTPLHKVGRVLPLMRALRSLITAHHDLYHKARVLHRNITLHNMAVEEHDESVGVLLGFEHAARLDTRADRQGAADLTIAYVAMDLLQDVPPRHEYSHDLESFLWAMLHLVTCYRGGRMVFPLLVQDWSSNRLEDMRVAKTSFLDAFSWNVSVKQFCASLGGNHTALLQFLNWWARRLADYQSYKKISPVEASSFDDVLLKLDESIQLYIDGQ